MRTRNNNSNNLQLQRYLVLGILLSAESTKAEGVRGSSTGEAESAALATLPPGAGMDEDFSSSGHDNDFQNSISANMMQAEDYIIMQMEMQWGMNEMHRYKSHRGEYPTRTASSLSLDDQQQPQQIEQDDGGESDYLDDLPSPFTSGADAKGGVYVASSLPASPLQVHETPLPPGDAKNVVQRPSGGTRKGSSIRDAGDEIIISSTGTDESDADHNDTNVIVEEDIPDELALILGAKTARTVEEYWDSLVSMF